MHKLLTQCFALIGSITIACPFSKVYGQDNFPIPRRAYEGAYTNQFRYFSKGNTDKPAGSDQVSDALIVMSYQFGRHGTAELINTYREDKKICICTAGHVVETWSLGSNYTDIYMKYLGQSRSSLSDQNANLGEVLSSYKSELHIDLVARADDNSGDWAVLLVDPDELPVRNFQTLGYVFNNQLYANTPPAKFYIMGHPWSTPQRIADSLSYLTSTQYNTTSPFAVLGPHTARVNPGGLAPAASGSPVMNNYLLSPALVGIFKGPLTAADELTVPQTEIPGRDLERFTYPNDFKYSPGSYRITKFSAPGLMAAIKKHCWAKTDSITIESDARYKTGVQHDNTQQVNEFGTTKAITSQAGLVAAADQSYTASNPGAALLKASTLTLSCTVTTSASLSRISGLAKEVVMNPGFEYTPTDSYQLDMNTVVPEMTASGTMSASSKENTSDTIGNESATVADSFAFNVYPNPSTNGTFHLSLKPTADPYRIEVFTTKGNRVYTHKIAPGSSTHKWHLNGLAHGSYILSIYNESSGKQLFSKVIVYL